MNNVKGLSINKDVSALKELSLNEVCLIVQFVSLHYLELLIGINFNNDILCKIFQVEKFMSQWSSNKEFRDDYEKRILSSLDARQLSRDGRMRNPDEKPILSVAPLSVEPETEPVKASMKKLETEKELARAGSKKEKGGVIPPKHEVISSRKTQEEVTVKPVEVEALKQVPEAEKSSVVDISPKKHSESNKIDSEKLKEMKREEENAKAKSAMERKKKLAEKAAAKAAIRAQKEAEKKLKASISHPFSANLFLFCLFC